MSVLIVRSVRTNPLQRIMNLADVFYIFLLILLLSFVSLYHILRKCSTDRDFVIYTFVCILFPSTHLVVDSCASKVFATADRRITTTTGWKGNTLETRVRTTL